MTTTELTALLAELEHVLSEAAVWIYNAADARNPVYRRVRAMEAQVRRRLEAALESMEAA